MNEILNKIKKEFLLRNEWRKIQIPSGMQFSIEGDAVKMLTFLRDNAINTVAYSKLSEEEREGKFVVGEFHNSTKQEFTQLYDGLIKSVSRETKLYRVRHHKISEKIVKFKNNETAILHRTAPN